MLKNTENQKTFIFLLKKRKLMLQLHLFKYLQYRNLKKLKLVCKDGNNVCDANKVEDKSD